MVTRRSGTAVLVLLVGAALAACSSPHGPSSSQKAAVNGILSSGSSGTGGSGSAGNIGAQSTSAPASNGSAPIQSGSSAATTPTTVGSPRVRVTTTSTTRPHPTPTTRAATQETPSPQGTTPTTRPLPTTTTVPCYADPTSGQCDQKFAQCVAAQQGLKATNAVTGYSYTCTFARTGSSTGPGSPTFHQGDYYWLPGGQFP